ncbi:phospholipase A2 inhibitor and Ly6/PLAUR domain-containing protein-like [Anomaloglossus baeobatrachus]|uniref:phospholipase A2 inhibitor and Ly6/PLAUR domain-containing protein-like n=1 Tax=Anomaloglossus baeobatrachus TaxID=238106 RepID=UPI003F4FE7D9
MKALILSIFLLAFSLHIARALNCYHCHERDSDTCKHELKECPDGDRCMTISEDYKLNRSYHSVMKGCAYNMPCGEVPYGRVNENLYIMVNTECCDTDGCNDGFYNMPEYDEPNGVMCPSCLEMDTLEECNKTHLMMCRAKDDKCVTFAGQVRKPDDVKETYSSKGCMSKLGCQFDLSQLIGVNAENATIYKCTDPPKYQSEEEESEDTSNSEEDN